MPSESENSNRQKWLVENILPSREVHLVAGPSGAGKTTWLLQFIQDWSAGKPIFNCRSHPADYVYVSGDRSLESVARTFERVGIKLEDIPHMSLVDIDDRDNVNTVFNAILAKHPQAKVIFMEGIAAIVPGGKNLDYRTVAQFILRLTALCQKNDRTIVGVVHSSKVKKEDRYQNPRQRVHGSVAWAAYTETIFLMEPLDPENADDHRRMLTVLPRNSAEEQHIFEFTAEGRLEMIEVLDANEGVFMQELKSFPKGVSLRSGAIFERFLTQHSNVSRRTLNHWLRKAEIAGFVAKTAHGCYQVVSSA